MQDKGILGRPERDAEPSIYSKIYDNLDIKNLDFTEACDL